MTFATLNNCLKNLNRQSAVDREDLLSGPNAGKIGSCSLNTSKALFRRLQLNFLSSFGEVIEVIDESSNRDGGGEGEVNGDSSLLGVTVVDFDVDDFH